MKEKKQESKNEEEIALDCLVLDYQKSKYEVVPLAAQWSKVLRRKEENRHLSPNELMEMAMKDVLSGRVSWKDVQKSASEPGNTEDSAEAEQKL